MMKALILSASLLGLAAVLAPAATAIDCAAPATLEVNGVYLDARAIPTPENPLFYSVWIFAESGVAAGLQRGGSQVAFAATGQQSTATMIGETDPDCAAGPASDLLIL